MLLGKGRIEWRERWRWKGKSPPSNTTTSQKSHDQDLYLRGQWREREEGTTLLSLSEVAERGVAGKICVVCTHTHHAEAHTYG